MNCAVHLVEEHIDRRSGSKLFESKVVSARAASGVSGEWREPGQY